MTRRSGFEEIMQLPAADFYEFYRLAKEKAKEERLFKMWAQQMPFMTKDNYISFEDYKDKLTGKNIDTRTTAELNEEIDEIEKAFMIERAQNGTGDI